MHVDTQRPNILWICTDQQRFDTLGCTGNAFVHTPNLDRLAAEGVLFEHCFPQSPMCAPSRASFLTGRYPRTTRCRQNGQSLPPDEVLITKRLADAGYICGLAGKLHVSACHPDAAPIMERRVDDGYSVFDWSHHPGGAVGKMWAMNAHHCWLVNRGVDYHPEPFEGSKYVQIGLAAEHSQAAWCADLAIEFIEAASQQDAPWLFSVNPYDPHHAFDPPEDYLRRYVDALSAIPLPNYVPGELGNKPLWQAIDHTGAHGGIGIPFRDMDEHDHRLIRAAYWAMVDLIDVQVGRMLDCLERLDQRQNTIVIFTSDHGEMLGDHGIYHKGPYFYEPAVHVPLIVSCPGRLQPGRRSRALVELSDLAPTLLDAAGLARPAGMQARSLWPLLTGASGLHEHRGSVYSEFYNSSFEYDPPAYGTMVRTDRHKLVAFHGCDAGELYDLAADPDETHNLWNEPEHLSTQGRMLKLLCDRMAETCDPLPEREAVW